ncbi:MAG TPA: hypothetical protein VFL81_02800, partial [Candidatus Saccharimonadales bacterium]|nr:hypothetical protein [Candidatus Saccharimonadales bacterium]
MDDQHYRRSLGLTYDESAYFRETANGLGGNSPEDAQEPFTKDGSDLYLESVNGSLNDQLLQDIEYALSFETDPEEIVILEAEKIVRTEIRLAKESQVNPKYSHALREWLFNELDRRMASGEPVDDEMYVEAEILADFIAEAQADEEDADLIQIASDMKEIIDSHKSLIDNARQADMSADEINSLIAAHRQAV